LANNKRSLRKRLKYVRGLNAKGIVCGTNLNSSGAQLDRMMHLQQGFDDDARATDKIFKVRVMNSVI
jgi:hypothetical protein